MLIPWLLPRVYNVQASAGEFILGEVGRIDNYGQTLQVTTANSSLSHLNKTYRFKIYPFPPGSALHCRGGRGGRGEDNGHTQPILWREDVASSCSASQAPADTLPSCGLNRPQCPKVRSASGLVILCFIALVLLTLRQPPSAKEVFPPWLWVVGTTAAPSCD